MGTNLAWSPAERWQALQNLESALGSPDTNMFFTYNGTVYRSVGVNGDGTMQVVNQATGQVTTLDPVDVYSAFQAASGNAIPSKQIVSPGASVASAAGPSAFGNVMAEIGMYSGMVNLAMQIKSVAKFLANMSHLSVQLLGQMVGGVTAFLSAYSAFHGIQDMFKNGFTWSGLLGVGMSTFGVASGVNLAIGASLTNPAGWMVAGAVISASVMYGAINDMIANGASVKSVAIAAASFVGTAVFTNLALMALHLFTFSSMFGPIGWAVAAAVAVFEILWSLFHQPPPEQVAAQNLTQKMGAIIWTPGPLLVVAVGTVALLMGWAKNRPPPVMASLTVPAYHLNEVLAASGIAPVDLKSKTPSVIVEPGTGNVIIVSPSGSDGHGNALVTLQSYQLSKNLQFVSSPQVPPDGAYIPFFRSINGKVDTHPNPDLVKALNIQDKMLMAVLSGNLLTHDALNALYVAAASNKYGVGLAQ